jgi:hypothetical protein
MGYLGISRRYPPRNDDITENSRLSIIHVKNYCQMGEISATIKLKEKIIET